MQASGIDCLRRFAPYAKLYKTLSYLGAESIVSEYLGLDISHALPFALAHGIQPIDCTYTQDLLQPEPIHWSYNRGIHDAASKVKVSVLLPHPWLLLKELKPLKSSRCGTLLIGPAPSRVNDEALYSLISKNALPDKILVKPRGQHVKQSVEFWKSRGIEPIICKSYVELYELFSCHHSVISSYPTSAIFLAASIGCSVRVIQNYRYYDFESFPANKEFLGGDTRDPWTETLMICHNPKELSHKSRELLGADLESGSDHIRKVIESAADKCQSYFFSSREFGPIRKSGYSLLSRLGIARPSFVSLGVRESIARRLNHTFFKKTDVNLYEFPSVEEIIAGKRARFLRLATHDEYRFWTRAAK